MSNSTDIKLSAEKRTRERPDLTVDVNLRKPMKSQQQTKVRLPSRDSDVIVKTVHSDRDSFTGVTSLVQKHACINRQSLSGKSYMSSFSPGKC